ncbi:DUF4153 domain-containing protein [Sphingopyxis flava]|uniref:DUF4153 domain-containing protein n=1 Tax=Sphingopyxis flava TaxID=1507287 RepID=A0A1T4ZQZ2_9SPHN|nr:DUF4153 domain-containing protein [Sphingopyxis flava]SKB25035.1 protein of unknown function [Sphingopyxis flava]
MSETSATPPALESPRSVSARLDAHDLPWPQRPWIMAAICAVAGLVFHLLVDRTYTEPHAPWRDASAAFVAISAVVFVLGVEIRRWHWAAAFALLWGAVMGLITWHSAGYNLNGSPIEWPFWSGILAVLVATPLFQTRRDVAPDARFWKLWQMPYARLHNHAWTDAVIGAAGLAFVGVTFLLVMLIGEMFHLIGIDLIRDLLRGEWFGWMLAGAAFGGAVGLLRERDKLVSTLQRLVMIVLAVLAPVLAAALILFLLSLLGTGLQKLWDAGFSTAGLMLGISAFAVLLANAVIGNGDEDRSGNRVLHGAAAVLAVAVLPLAIIAAVSMQVRIAQYGWTPERIWGVIAVGIALAYGIAGVAALARRRRDFDVALRPLQQTLAIGLMLLAAFLALPILDFGAISTRDQVARLESGAVSAEKFDWAALAFDFGPSGRRALQKLAASQQTERANLAKWALAAKNRWDLRGPGEVDAKDAAFAVRPIEERVRVLPVGAVLPPEFYTAMGEESACRTSACAVYVLGEGAVALIARGSDPRFFVAGPKPGEWRESYGVTLGAEQPQKTDPDLETATIELRPVARRQLFVDGKPVGDPFE